MEENNNVMQKLHISASGLNNEQQSSSRFTTNYSFTDFLLKYNLENKATSNIKIQEVLKKLNLSLML